MAIGDIIGGVGSLAGGIFGAIGDSQAASAYRRAGHEEQGMAVLTAQQIPLEASAMWIKQQQAFHQTFSAIGQGVSQQAGYGMRLKGSGSAIIAGSARQGANAQAMLSLQGKSEMMSTFEKVESMGMQAGMDAQMAKKEDTAAMGSLVGGAIGAVGGMFKAFGAGASSGDDAVGEA